MENKLKNVIEENDSKDEIFKVQKDDDYAVDKNGVLWQNYGNGCFFVFVSITENTYDKYYEITAQNQGEKDETKLLGKVYFSELSKIEQKQIKNLIKTKKKLNYDLRLLCVPDDAYSCECHIKRKRIKWKHCCYLVNQKLLSDDIFIFDDLLNPFYMYSATPFLDCFYLRMFFPEIYEREKRIDEKNDHIELNFYSKRKKILWGESLSYAILLALSVVAMVFSLINLMIFIIAAAVLTVIFGFGLLYEFKFRKIPYIDKLPQEEINKIKKQIEQEKNKNKDDKDDKDDKKEEDKNLMEINTDSRKKDEESLI